MNKQIWKSWVACTGAVALAGCLGSAPSDPNAGSGGADSDAAAGSHGDGGPSIPASLANRQIDYGQALRTAGLKLVGALPSLDEIAGVTDASSYAAQIDKYLADPRFSRQIRSYFQDLMKMGGNLTVQKNGAAVQVSLDTAPTFAAELAVNDRAMTELFTASTNTCPTLHTDGKFTDAACATANGQGTVGVLTDPGAMAQLYSNLAFRRVRWIQESFDCSRFPAEYSSAPVPMGQGQYVSPWPFDSIQGGTDKTVAPINFKDTSSVLCANCHSTMNHLAPLFASFDGAGVYQSTIQVHTPVPMTPPSKLSDWLPAGQQSFAWRFGKAVTNLSELGQAMSADPEVMSCQVKRAWNWAMSKTDIVNDLAIAPASTVQSLEQGFAAGGFKMKPMLKAIFTGGDFVKF